MSRNHKDKGRGSARARTLRGRVASGRANHARIRETTEKRQRCEYLIKRAGEHAGTEVNG